MHEEYTNMHKRQLDGEINKNYLPLSYKKESI